MIGFGTNSQKIESACFVENSFLISLLYFRFRKYDETFLRNRTSPRQGKLCCPRIHLFTQTRFWIRNSGKPFPDKETFLFQKHFYPMKLWMYIYYLLFIMTYYLFDQCVFNLKCLIIQLRFANICTTKIAFIFKCNKL